MKKAIFITTILLLLGAASAAETNITNPKHDSTVDFSNQDLNLQWESIQTHSSEDSLIDSEIRIESSSGTYTTTLDRSSESSLSNGESAQYSLSLTSSDLSDLESGFWDVEITDRWEESSDGANVQSIDQLIINAENVGGGSASSVGVVIDAPGANYEYTVGNDLLVEWTSEVEGEAELVESRIVVTGDQGSTYETTVSQGQFYSSDTQHSVTIDSSNLGFTAGSWNIEVTDEWSSSEASDDRFFSASSGSDDDSGGSGGATNIEDDGSSDGSTDSGSDDDSNSDSTDDDSGVIVGGGDGSSSDDSTSEDSTDETDQTTDSSDETSESSDSTDGSDQETNESDSNESTSNESGSLSSSSSNDTSNSPNCPEGFTYNEERGVCVEDISNQDQSKKEDSSDSSDGETESTDPRRSDGLLQKEVAAGITVQMISLVLMIMAVILVLFKRSSYKLAF